MGSSEEIGQLDEKADAPHRAISCVVAKGVHGKFDYTIDVAPRQSDADSGDPPASLSAVSEDRLTLLYGRNGTGKTTVLRLLFHALSPANDRGHRTALKQLRFREFTVSLSDGSFVRYVRDGAHDLGPFDAEIRLGSQGEVIESKGWGDSNSEPLTGQLTLSGDLSPAELEQLGLRGDVEQRLYFSPFGDKAEIDRARFIAALGDLGINPIFLEDSRAITGDVLEREEAKRRRASAARRARTRRDLEDELLQRRDIDIHEALDRVVTYLSQLAFAGTQAGSRRVDNVYVDVTELIIEHSSKPGRPNKRIVPELRSEVEKLSKRAKRFHDYGLLSDAPMSDLADRLHTADDKHGPLLRQVLEPHLRGFSQRMDELEPALDAVSAFVDALSSFIVGKKVTFRPGRRDLTITDTETDEVIDPRELSSGEKQVVLMFSDVIALQGDTKLFLIDEPELSLNPDWQRKLMPSLLSVTHASGMQLIAATHSIEIMARYRDRRQELAG